MNSLVNSISNNKYAIDTIKLGIKTQKGKNLLWIIVEADDDVSLFKRFFNKNETQILASRRIENNNCGCENVLTIVDEILNGSITDKIVGIRDRDYIFFKNPNYKLPQNIFVTDERDLEMMLFKSLNVQDAFRKFKKVYGRFDECYEKSLATARKIGYLRIYNDINTSQCDFHEAINWGKILDTKTGDLIGNWKNVLINLFNTCNKSSTKITILIYDQLCINYNTYDSSIICRGHDVVTLLSNYIKHNFSKDEICTILINNYLCDDFKKTILFSSLNTWKENNGMTFNLLN